MSPNKIDAVSYATAQNAFEAAVDNRAFGRARKALEAACVDNCAYGGARPTLNATCVDNGVNGGGAGVKKFVTTGIDCRVGDSARSEEVLIASVDRRPDTCVPYIEDAAFVENREEGLTARVDIFDTVFVDDCAGGHAAAKNI